MKKSVVIAVAIALAATGWLLSGRFAASGDEAAQPGAATAVEEERPLTSVRVAHLTAQPMVDTIRLLGRTEADRMVELRAEVSGRVVEVLAERGAVVDEGQTLIRLSVEDREAELARARAVLRQREIEYEAADKLLAQGFQSEMRHAEAAALLDEARAELERAELALENTTIEAPFDGVLDRRPVEIGDWVAVGQEVATIIDLDPIKVAGQVSELTIGQISVGSTGRADVPGGPELEGTITYISAMADPATRTFEVELSVPNPDRRLLQGQTTRMMLPLDQRMAHLVSPAFLALDDDGKVGVKVVDDDNRVQFLPVQILSDTPEGVWLGGLPEQVDVITVGHEFVTPGQAVRPVPVGDGSLS